MYHKQRVLMATSALALAFLAAMAGCDSSGRHGATGPMMAPADLSLPESSCPSSGYVLVDEGRWSGRFPVALAVAKLHTAPGGGWQAMTLKEEQAVWWNSLFNTSSAIREVIVMGERTAGPPGSGPVGMIGKARRLDAALCLVYGPASTGVKEAGLIGALYDTFTGRPVARIQAQATEADFQSRRSDAPSGDRRHVDPQYLVNRKFEQQVRMCIDELITRDAQQPPAVQKASPNDEP